MVFQSFPTLYILLKKLTLSMYFTSNLSSVIANFGNLSINAVSNIKAKEPSPIFTGLSSQVEA